MQRLRYGNTNTFFIEGDKGGLLVDTDYAGTLRGFFRALKGSGIRVEDIKYLLCTHYHPDHMGIAGDLQKLGVTLLIADVQKPFIHYSDRIFGREKKLGYEPPDESAATVISCEESRAFLKKMGIGGEIVSVPSHSDDSVALILDDGDCIVGDLEPFEFIDGYDGNRKLRDSWEKIMSRHPKRILFAHANEKNI